MRKGGSPEADQGRAMGGTGTADIGMQLSGALERGTT